MTGTYLRRVPDMRAGGSGAIDFQYGEISAGVDAGERRIDSRAVGEDDLDTVFTANSVCGRYDDARAPDHT